MGCAIRRARAPELCDEGLKRRCGFLSEESNAEAAITAWIERQPEPKPSRSEAIRRLIERGLANGRRA